MVIQRILSLFRQADVWICSSGFNDLFQMASLLTAYNYLSDFKNGPQEFRTTSSAMAVILLEFSNSKPDCNHKIILHLKCLR